MELMVRVGICSALRVFPGFGTTKHVSSPTPQNSNPVQLGLRPPNPKYLGCPGCLWIYIRVLQGFVE